ESICFMCLDDVSLRTYLFYFFLTDPVPTEISTLSLHDALPISALSAPRSRIEPCSTRSSRSPARSSEQRHRRSCSKDRAGDLDRSEEHTSELQSLTNLVCRLLLEKKKEVERHDKTI